MVHVQVPGVLVMVMATPFLKGSVFEYGTMRTMCKGAESDGKN